MQTLCIARGETHQGQHAAAVGCSLLCIVTMIFPLSNFYQYLSIVLQQVPLFFSFSFLNFEIIVYS